MLKPKKDVAWTIIYDSFLYTLWNQIVRGNPIVKNFITNLQLVNTSPQLGNFEKNPTPYFTNI